MKNDVIELAEIQTYRFGKKMIFSLDERWSEYFNSKNISFKVVINNNKLMLIGPRISHQEPTTKSTSDKEMTSKID